MPTTEVRHELISPKPCKYKLSWEPRPFFAQVTGDGIECHPNPEVPNSKVLLAVKIPKVQFDRHAEYYTGGQYHGVWQTLQFTGSADPIYLINEDGTDEIYCLSIPFGIPLIIGKLSHETEVYKICMNAFCTLR
jgi:hypothetical protein